MHTDASHGQLGAVVSQDQDNHPTAFCSQKMNEAQTRHTTAQRELLSAAETLKEFRIILLGHKTVMWTYHENPIHDDPKSERVLQDVCHIKGPENTAADALGRSPIANDPEKPHIMSSCEELADCFAEKNEENWLFPVSVTSIKSHQQLILDSAEKAASDDPACAISPFRGGAVICHNNKVATPLQLRTHVVKWHHKIIPAKEVRRKPWVNTQHGLD
jgi:hypothetical protein